MDSIDQELIHMEANVLNANSCMIVTLESLVNEGLLQPDEAKKFAHTHGIVVLKRSWFKRIFGTNKDAYHHQCVRLVATTNDQQEGGE